MAGEVYLSLLNPSIAFSFAGLAALLLHRWPTQIHLFPLGLCFFYLGLGFITQEWPLLSAPGAINYAGNALFFAAVLLACISALVRVRVKVPVVMFTVTCMVAAAGFAWFARVEPSTLARIGVLHGCFVVMAGITALRLVSAGVYTLADRLFLTAVSLGIVLALARPLLIFLGLLELNAAGGVTGSAYWASVVGVTPFLSILVVSLFVFALVLDIVGGLKREADHDYLTGLLNRRGFETGAAERLPGLAQAQVPPALLIADIDDFKQINDRFGHGVGDAVIAAVGQVLAQHGDSDLAGRVGGEEFALFYAMASRRMLENRASAIREALVGLPVDGLPAGYNLTISIGLHVRDGDESTTDMMRRADRALYEAKAAGKNRAVLTPVRLRTV